MAVNQLGSSEYEAHNIVNLLLNIAGDDSSKSVEHYIAIGLLENLRKLPDLSISQMSSLCYASTASLSKFCKRISDGGYTNLRTVFSKYLSSMERHRSPYAISDDALQRISVVKGDILNETQRAIENIGNQLSASNINAAIDAIKRSEHTYLIIESGYESVVREFQYHMALAGKFMKTYTEWVHSTETHPNSLRFILEIQKVENHREDATAALTSFFVSERLKPEDGGLYDLHLTIEEQRQYVTSYNRRYVNAGGVGPYAMACCLRILYTTYSESMFW